MNIRIKSTSFFLIIIPAMLLVSCDKDNSESDDLDRLAQMKREIIDMIGEPTCGDSTDCRIIGFGAKPCGGYWEYLVYSIADLDTTLLIQKVNQYNEFNETLNRRYGWESDCMVTPVPEIECIDGVCTAVY